MTPLLMPKLGKRVADLTLSESIPSIEAIYKLPSLAFQVVQHCLVP